MRDVCISKYAKYACKVDTNSREYTAIESFLAENPQPSNCLTRECTRESFRVKECCEDFPDLEKGLENKGQLSYERIMGESNFIAVLYSYDDNKVIIHYYAESPSPLPK